MTRVTADYLFGVWGSTPDDVFAAGGLGVILHHSGQGPETQRYALTMSYILGENGQVYLDPEPNDSNLPEYASGTEVLLTAVPIEGKGFKHWWLFDPNHPGDSNHVFADSNNPTTILMDADREVTAIFTCCLDVNPLPPVMLGMLGLTVWIRRRA